MQNTANFSLRRQFINTNQAAHVFARISEVHQDTRRSGTSKALLVQGPSGAGKTTLIREFISTMFPNGPVPGQQLPAIRVDIPSSPSKKNLAAAMLMALGDPFASSRTHSAEAKFSRIVTLLKNLKTEIVILDEAQHLVDYKRNSAYEAADWIKSLMNDAEITVILVGLKRTQGLLWANEQLRRRFSACVDYDRFDWNSSEGQWHFAALVRNIQRILPVPTIDFTNREILPRFYHACFGLIDYLIKILDRAIWRVQSGHEEGIDQRVLADAFRDEVWSRAPHNRNPFATEFDFKPLIGSREPFENFDGPNT